MNGRDVHGYSLQYYAGDYTARHGNDFLSYSDAAAPMPTHLSLYNGNIREMYTASTNTNEEYIGTSHTSYNYDQLNRIMRMTQENLTGGSIANHGVLGGNYESDYSYDANGNLSTLNRWADNGTGTKIHIDEFNYHYNTDIADEANHNNQLNYVHDNKGASVMGDDLADQSIYTLGSDYNYAYDEIGQLIQDKQEEIASIEWKVTGKVHKIIRNPGSSKSNLEFVYDAMGNRIMKIETDNAGALLKKVYYLRDAQGNVMSIYTLADNTSETLKELKLTERSIYGSSRVGTENPGLILDSYDPGFTATSISNQQLIGDRNYELSNHLGNVLQVVSDRKLAVETAPESGVVDYYIADVVSQSDYYPFGMMLPNRNESGDEYRYGFQGQEKDDEVSGNSNSYDFGARLYNPRVGRWLSRDPADKSFPWQSPYVSMDNNPVLKMDPIGESGIVTVDHSNKTITVSSHMIFYGEASSTKLATDTASDIQAVWNEGASDYFVEIEGEMYSVTFEIKGSYIDVVTKEQIEGDNNPLNNYVKIVNDGIPVSGMDKGGQTISGEGSNTGQFLVSDIEGSGSTTEAHEYGHGLGLIPGTRNGHPQDLDMRGKGQPGIMSARGTLVDAEYTYNPDLGSSTDYIPGDPSTYPTNTLDPRKRAVTHDELDILKEIILDDIENGEASTSEDGNLEIKVGTTTNVSQK
jgi:RHS repeat-associated protein